MRYQYLLVHLVYMDEGDNIGPREPDLDRPDVLIRQDSLEDDELLPAAAGN